MAPARCFCGGAGSRFNGFGKAVETAGWLVAGGTGLKPDVTERKDGGASGFLLRGRRTFPQKAIDLNSLFEQARRRSTRAARSRFPFDNDTPVPSTADTQITCMNEEEQTPTSIPLDGLAAAQISKSLENTQVGKFHTKGGLGFAAEEANGLADKLRLRRVEMTGVNNAQNGADRIVNGISIQTKYYAAARETLQSAFDTSSGLYRYDGNALEVPKDQYDECLALLRQKIADGKVPQFADSDDAENILKCGSITYKQARNISQAGNIDSLLYDATTQAVTSSKIFAISLAVEFAQRRWRGQIPRAALNDSLVTALASGSKSIVTGIVAAQLLRSQAARTGTVLVRTSIKGLYRTSLGKTAIEQIAAGSLGKSIYGAAALNRVSKLLRSNAITSAVTMVVVTTPDFYHAAIARNISWSQFTKNLLVNAAGLAAGVGGWMAGAGLGAMLGSVVPVLGTAAGGIVGGIVGALAGGMGGSGAAKAGLDCLIEDDAKTMLTIVQRAVDEAAYDHLLLESEIPSLVEFLKNTVVAGWLRQMFQAGAFGGGQNGSYQFAYDVFAEHCRFLLKKRPKVILPSSEMIARRIGVLVKEVSKQTSFEDVPVED